MCKKEDRRTNLRSFWGLNVSESTDNKASNHADGQNQSKYSGSKLFPFPHISHLFFTGIKNASATITAATTIAAKMVLFL